MCRVMSRDRGSVQGFLAIPFYVGLQHSLQDLGVKSVKFPSAECEGKSKVRFRTENRQRNRLKVVVTMVLTRMFQSM